MASRAPGLAAALVVGVAHLLACGGAAPVPDASTDAGVALDPDVLAEAWCDAFAAGEVRPVPDTDPLAGAVFEDVLECGLGPAVAFVQAAGSARLRGTALGDEVARALDVYLYRLGYRGGAPEQRHGSEQWHAIAAFAPALGEVFVLRKHAVVAALTQARADGTAELELLAGGDAEVVASLAFEFATRGAHVAAAAAWRHAAGMVSDERAAAWLRHAADSDFALGRFEAARRALDASVEAAGDAIAAWGAAHDVARQRGDEGYVPAGVVEAAAEPCTPDNAERVVAAELVLARHEVDLDEVVAAGRRLRTRVDAGCGAGTIGAAGGLLMLEARRADLAVPLLHAAVLERPRDLDLVTALLGAVQATDDPVGTVEVVAAVLAPLLAEPDTVAPHTALALGEALTTAGTRTGWTELVVGATALIEAVGDARPENFDLAVARMTPPIGALDLAVLDAYVAASADRVTAALAVGGWLEERPGDEETAADWFVDLTDEPGADTPVPALDGLRADAWAWLRAALLFGGMGRVDDAAACADAYLAAAADDPSRWRRLFRAGTIDQLPVGVRADLARRAAADGETSTEVYLALGAAALALGDRTESADAYARVIVGDPAMVRGVVDTLSGAGDHDVLARALERASQHVDSTQVRLALGIAHARLAARAGGGPTGALHRATARRSFLVALDGGATWDEIPRSILRDARLFDLAAARSDWRLATVGPDPGLAIDLAVDLADAGAPEERLLAVVATALDELGADDLAQLRVRFAAAGYPRAALVVGERELDVHTGSAEAFAATVTAVVGLATWLDDRDAVRVLVTRHLVEPARALETTILPVPPRFRGVEDRALAAANLLREASRLYFDAAMWAASADLALEALALDGSNPTVLLPRAIVARLRAGGGELRFEAVETLAARAGGDAFAWRLTAFTLQEAQRWELSARAWERALTLEPDDWAAGGQLGRVLAVMDRTEEAYQRFDLACVAARRLEGVDAEGEVAVLGADALRAAGRPDLATRLLTGRPDAGAQAALAEVLMATGRTADALRLVETSPIPAPMEIRLLVAAGELERAARTWQDRGAAIAPDDTLLLLQEHADLLFAHLQPAEVEDLVRVGLGSGWHPADIDLWLAREYAARGRFLAAAVLLERHLPVMSDDDRVYVAALFAAAGARETMWDVVSGIGASPFGTVEVDDRSLPARGVTELLARYGHLDDLLPALDTLATRHPEPTWTRLHRALTMLALGDGSEALEAVADLVAQRARRPPDPGSDAAFDRRLTSALAALANAGFGREVGDLATVAGDPDFELAAARAYGAAGALPEAAEAVRRYEDRLTGEAAAQAAGCLELALGGLSDQVVACYEALSGPMPYDERARVMVSAWRAGVAADDPGLAALVIAAAERPGPPLEPGDVADAAVAGYDVRGAASARPMERFVDDDDLLDAFLARYQAGDVDGAVDLVASSWSMAARPVDLVDRAIASIHPGLDPDAARRLAGLAVELSPGDTRARLRAFALGSEDDAWLRDRACRGDATWDVLAALAADAPPEAVVAIGDAAGACGTMPGAALPAYSVALARVGRVQDALDTATTARLAAPPSAIEAAARAALDASLPEVALVLLDGASEGVSDGGTFAALRARARAATGDIDGAATEVARWLRAPSPMDLDGSALIADLAAAGALGLAERVADTIFPLPPAWPEGAVGGWEIVAAGWADGDAEAGLSWFRLRHGDIALFPALAGASVAHATLLELAGDVDGAIAVYEQALAYEPDAPVMANNLAYVLAVHGRDLEHAEQLARSALVRTEVPDVGFLDTLGWVLHRQGRDREAAERVAAALRLLASEPGFDPAGEASTVLLGHLAEIDAALARTRADEDDTRAGHRGRGRRR